MDLALDRAFEVRSKIDKMEEELSNFVTEIKSLENKTHNIRGKLLILGVNADDFAKRKTFDVSKLLPSIPTPQVTPTLQVTPTPQVMSTPQPILVNKVLFQSSLVSKPPPSPTVGLDLNKEISDMEETMQNTNNALLEETMDTMPRATSEETMDTMPQATPAADLDSANPTISGLIFQLPGTSGQILSITTPPKTLGLDGVEF